MKTITFKKGIFTTFLFTAIILLLSVSFFSVQAQNCSAPAAPFVNWSGCNKEGNSLGFSNLSGANLSGAILINANLSGANLSGANLTNAVLDSANLFGANLTGANLSGANLIRVVSGGIIGTPTALPAGWALVNGYLVTPLTATQSQVNTFCNGGCNGSATVVASGGAAPYTYAWSPTGGTAATASGLCAGTYTCTIMDNASSTITKSFNITEPSPLEVSAASQTNEFCYRGYFGSASINLPTGGTAPYTYNWTPGNPTGDGTRSVKFLSAGDWTCTVMDANGCTATSNFTITQPSAIVVSAASQTNVSCNGQNNGAASVNTTGGTPGYIYNWNPRPSIGDGTPSVSGLSAGTWTCYVTDSNGCYKTQTFYITVNDTQAPVISCQANITGIVATSAAGAVVNYTTPVGTDNCTGAVTTRTAGLASGDTFPIGTTTVTHRVTDAAGLTAECSFTVTVVGVAPAITCPANITVNNTTGQCGAAVTFAATETVGSPASVITYSIASGSNFSVGTTQVTATATNAVGSSSCTFDVIVNDTEAPSITCPIAVTVNANEGQCYATNVLLGLSLPIAIINPDFEILYKAGSTSVTSPLLGIGKFAYGITNSNMGGPTVTFSDGSTGNRFDFPGWTFNAPNSLAMGITNENSNFGIGRNMITFINGVTFGGGSAEKTMSQTLAENLQQNTSYTLTADFGWRNDNSFASPPVLKLYAGATLLTPIASNSPALVKGSFVTYTRTYLINNNAISGPLRIEFGIDANTNSEQLNTDHITLSKALATDNCAIATVIPTLNGNPVTAATQFPVGNNTVIWTATDTASNTVTCNQTIRVNDTQAPVISCQANITNVVATSAAGAVVNYTTPVGTDNCTGAITTRTAGLASGDTFPIGTTTVTHLVTDAAGLTAECSFTVTVGVAPAITCPANITVNNTTGQCGAAVTFAATETVGIPASVITYSTASGSNFPVGTTTVTATATNAVGSSSCTFTVIVNDTQLPIWSSSPFEINNGSLVTHPGAGFGGADASANLGSVWGYANQISSNNRVADDFVISEANGFTINEVVVYGYQTGSGTTSTLDNVNLRIWNGEPDNGGTVIWGDVSTNRLISSTFSGIYRVTTTTLTNTQRPIMKNRLAVGGLHLPAGTYWLDWQVGGSSTLTGPWACPNSLGGNGKQSVNGSAFFPIYDGPTASGFPFEVKGNTTPSAQTGLCGTIVNYLTPSASDNCTVTTSQTTGLPSGSLFPVGVTTNTFTATDAAGNTITTSFDVTIIDNEKPVISCPADITDVVATSADGAVVTYSTPVGTDNCTGATTTRTAGLASGDTFPIGTTTVTHLVTDAAGLTTSCSFDVTVVGVAPELECTGNIFVSNDANQCGAIVTFDTFGTLGIPAAMVTYSTSSGATTSGSVFPVGTTYVTATATNDFGSSSCSFGIYVNDTQAPVISCQANITNVVATSAAGAVVNYTTPFGTDNCTGAITTRTAGLASGATFPIGTTTVTHLVTDAAGLTAECSFTVTVVGVAPAITCPANITVNNTTGQCGAAVTFAATETVGIPASVITYSIASGSNFSVGTTQVTATATNDFGSSSCSFGIYVNDTEAPVISCPGNIVVSNDANQCGAVVIFTDVRAATATDNCGTATITYSPVSGSFFANGITTVTVTADDGHGNTTPCSFTVTVNDTQAPVITCAANIVVSNDSGVCGATVNATSPIVLDNCGTGGLTFDGVNNLVVCPEGVVPTTGDFTVSVWAQCLNNNPYNSIFSQGRNLYLDHDPDGYIRVGDTWLNTGVLFPTDMLWHHYSIVSTSTDTRLFIDGILRASKGSPINSPNQNAGGSVWPYNLLIGCQWFTDEFVHANIDELQIWNTALSASDINTHKNQLLTGNEAGLVGYYNFEDGPGSSVLTNLKNNTNNGSLVNMNTSTAWIASPILINVTNSFNQTNDASGVYPIGTTAITWTATDASGNTATCNQTVTVNDTQAPVISCQANITNVVATSAAGAVVNYTTPVGTDNCTGAVTTRTAGLASGDTFPIGTTTVTHRVTDAAGLTAECSFTVTVVGVAPAITCPANITVNNTTGQCGAAVTFAATETVGIPASVITYSIASGSNFSVGTTQVTATATNAVGISSCTFDVIVKDTEKPVITCPANISATSNIGCATAVVVGTATATDNCGVDHVSGVRSDALSLNALYPVGLTTITWTATDIHGIDSTICEQTVTVTGQQAVASISSQTICSGLPMSNIAVSGGVLGTTYSWTRDNGANVTGIATSGSGNISGGVLTNTTTVPVTVTFTITPNYNGCAGKSITAIVIVNPKAETPVISGNAPFCQGYSVTLDAGSGYASYSWSNGATTQTTAVSNATPVSVSVTNSFGCSATSLSVTPVVNTLSVAPTSITPSVAIATPGSNFTLSVNGGSLGTAANWKWYTASCGGTLVGTGASISVSQMVNTTYYVRAEGTCNTTACASVTVNIKCGASVITSSVGTTTVCPGTVVTLTPVGALSTGAQWRWDDDCDAVPSTSDASATYTTASSFTVTPTKTTTYYLQSVGGACGVTACLSVTVNVIAKPATPGTIGGLAIVCPSTTGTYSIAAVSTATSYTWTAPSNATMVVAANGLSAVLTYNSAFVSGTLSVTANNCAGASTAKTLAITKTAVPATPGTITGLASVCPSTSGAYSIATVANATSYTWTAPANASITAGQGTASVTVSYASGYTTGTLSVKATGCGGTSAAKTLTVTKTTAPATPGTISGVVTVCASTSGTYSIAAVANATSYTWIAPANATITAGQGTTSVTVSYASGFTTGTLSVTATGCGGTSIAKTLAITKTAIPVTPGAITGASPACAASTQTYSITAVTNATSYTWTLPTGMSYVASTSTTGTSIQVVLASTFSGGTLSVKATNCSGSSANVSRVLTASALPTSAGTITGPITVCKGAKLLTYSVAAATGFTFNWSVPAGAVITAGAGTNSIKVTWGTVSGNVSVTKVNSCGNSAASILAVSSATCRETEDVVAPFAVIAYPNPFTDNFSLDVTTSLEDKIEMKVYDMIGKLIETRIIEVSEIANQEVGNNYAAGVYNIVVTQGAALKTLRVIKR